MTEKNAIGSRYILRENKGFAEVVGFYPGGQGQSKLDEYKLIYNGAEIRLDANNLALLFEPEEAAIEFFVRENPMPVSEVVSRATDSQPDLVAIDLDASDLKEVKVEKKRGPRA
jgi:hypothetical protein